MFLDELDLDPCAISSDNLDDICVAKCMSCKKEFPVIEMIKLYTHSRKVGRITHYKCKKCVLNTVGEWKAKNREKYLAIQKANYVSKKRKVENICSLCCKIKTIEKHHPDYSNPTKVVFLCRSCHKKIHAMTNKGMKLPLLNVVDISAGLEYVPRTKRPKKNGHSASINVLLPNEMRELTLKQRILLVGRQAVADAIGMPRPTFYAKFAGTRSMTELDKRAILTAVVKLERKLAA